jgi:putative Mn2+ efflux pump MntP
MILNAVGLAMDASAVSLVAGACGAVKGRRAAFRLAFHFGLFQFMMPVIGWFIGSRIAGLISSVDHWVAFALLAIVGGRMIRSGFDHLATCPPDPSRGMTLLTLSLATSIDALAIGLSLAMLQVSIWQPSAIIGLVTAALSLIALQLGKRLGMAIGKRMEIAGGVLLFLIGLRILLSHLTA